MFNYEQLTKMTPDEIQILSGLLPITEAAKKAVKIIKEVYTFHIGEEKLVVWEDGNNFEYITQTGIWQARYLHQKYDVAVDEKTIFDYFAAQFICNERLLDGLTDEEQSEIKQKEMIARYLTKFIRMTEKKYLEVHSDEESMFGN